MSTPCFYDSHFIGNNNTCSVCGQPTTKQMSEFSAVAICSRKCKDSYTKQWQQCGLELNKNHFMFKGLSLMYDTDMLEKNKAGVVCIVAWDPNKGDEYNMPPKILLPVDQVKEANLLLRQ